VALVACLVAGTFAAGQGSNAPSSAKSKKPSLEAVAARLSEMQKAIEAQQRIQQLVEQGQSRDNQIHKLQQQMNQVQGSASQAQPAADAATSENTQEEQNITVIRPQFSCVGRNTWSGVGEPHGLDGMIFTSFRYYLS
jgi:chromosome segregation ATPase